MPHAAPDLEALLPGTFQQIPLTKQSTGAEVLPQPFTRVMTAFLANSGKTLDDIQIAQAYDPHQGIRLSVAALRVKGVAGSAFQQAVSEAFQAVATTATATDVTLSGKKVTKLSVSGGTSGRYLYLHDDVVFVIAAADETLAAEGFATLP